MRQISEWQELGLILHQRRSFLTLTPEDVFEKTHISIETVEKIEKGLFNEIPGIYLQDFLKRYTLLLGLTETRVNEKYEAGLAEYDRLSLKETRSHAIRERIGPVTRSLKYLLWALCIIIALQSLVLYRLMAENRVIVKNNGNETVEIRYGDSTRSLMKSEEMIFDKKTAFTVLNPGESSVMIQYGQQRKEISWIEFGVE
jgi:cytoskeletal protein RodZ